MIKSMTGYGRYEEVTEYGKITVEMKAVNHRYLDLGMKMPRKFYPFEAELRVLLKDFVQRGKVDLFLVFEEKMQKMAPLSFHRELAEEYLNCYHQMEQEFGIPFDIAVSDLAKCPEVLTREEPELEDGIWPVLKRCVETCAGQFVLFKKKEGERLSLDIKEKLALLERLVEKIEERSPKRLEEYQEKLQEKVKEFLEDSVLDESRIAAEVLIYADRICVDEETVRLKSHITEMRQSLEAEQSIGRKLDFIAQEMNREANTILSKSNDTEMSGIAIDLKTEIEKIREQIQNIE